MEDPMDSFVVSLDQRKRIRKALNKNAFYIIIAISSLLLMFITPLVAGSVQGDVSIYYPKTVSGWVLWSMTNGAAAFGNIAILILFKLQAKRNCRDDENFKKANAILGELVRAHEEYIPRSPAKMNAREYASKGTMIALSTLSSFVLVSSVVISFDPVTLLSAVISTTIAVSVGWVTMINNEEYWTTEFVLYAEWLKKKKEQEKDERRN